MKILIILLLSTTLYSQNFSFERNGRLLTNDNIENMDDLIDYYENLVSTYPDSFLIADDLASLYYYKKKYHKAIKLFNTIKTKFHNKSVYATGWLSKSFFESGNVDSAIIIIKDELKSCIDCSVLYINLADIYISENNFFNAFNCFQNVVPFTENVSASTLNNYAYVCSVIDTNLIEAERLAIQAIKKSTFPENFYIYDTLGDIQFDLKKYKEAKISYKKAFEYMPMSQIEDKLILINEILNIKSEY